MKLEAAEIRNFRMLKELDIDFENNLTLIIGKNNSGKTSFLSIFQKFLSENKPEFAFEDFSIEIQKTMLALENTNMVADKYEELSLSLKLIITYGNNDKIDKASALILDLDSNNHRLVVLFEYVLEYEKYNKMISDYKEYRAKGIKRSFAHYIGGNINKYFIVRIKALEYENENNFKIINGDIVKSLISLQTIGAKRDVDNEKGNSKALSSLAGKYYSASVESESEFPELQKKLSETDESLTEIYQELFEPIVKEISEMSYNPEEAELSILSTLSEKKIFQDNTTVKYKHGHTLLPEDYNGLGYLNLFAIIFNIRIKLDQLSKKNRPDENPTSLNLLFIEEPEAHTHPQMQYIFIKNIKKILQQHCLSTDDNSSLQTIISTHSSHIVSQCDFQDIKYFYRESNISVKSRSLKNLYSKMVVAEDAATKDEQERSYRFVKQYVTLNRAELFFADKAILIEGDTERILLSAMMKKADEEYASSTKTLKYEPLLSQNISLIEVGAYSHIFATFLGFLGIKTLIITDLDCAKKSKNNRLNKCSFIEGEETSNASIKHFTKLKELPDIMALYASPIILSYCDATAEWNGDKNGKLRLIFQKEENGYQARSFEDAFICTNLQFVIDNKNKFISLKNIKKITSKTTDYYKLADSCIDSKTSFALEVLLYGGEKNEKWSAPLYIKEGLQWLMG